jgi:hypothetical protein
MDDFVQVFLRDLESLALLFDAGERLLQVMSEKCFDLLAPRFTPKRVSLVQTFARRCKQVPNAIPPVVVLNDVDCPEAGDAVTGDCGHWEGCFTAL